MKFYNDKMVFFTLHFFPILSYPLLVHCDFRRCKNAHMHKRVPSNIPYGNTQLQQQPTNNEPTKHTISSTWHSTNLHRVFGLNFSIFTMLIHKCEIRKKKKKHSTEKSNATCFNGNSLRTIGKCKICGQKY